MDQEKSKFDLVLHTCLQECERCWWVYFLNCSLYTHVSNWNKKINIYYLTQFPQ